MIIISQVGTTTHTHTHIECVIICPTLLVYTEDKQDKHSLLQTYNTPHTGSTCILVLRQDTQNHGRNKHYFNPQNILFSVPVKRLEIMGQTLNVCACGTIAGCNFVSASAPPTTARLQLSAG